MSTFYLTKARCLTVALTSVLLLMDFSSVAFSQSTGNSSIYFRVNGPSRKLRMIANTSRILTLDKQIVQVKVNNEELVTLVPLAADKIQIAARHPGVTQVILWDEDGDVHTIDVSVTGDAQELKWLLESEFPNASLRVRPLNSSVAISGYVDRPEVIGPIIEMAEDYYPKVYNNISVGGVQQVLLNVKVMEVSRTKLRAMGFDWADVRGSEFLTSGVSGLISPAVPASGQGGDTIRFSVLDGNHTFFGYLEALRQHNLVKLLAEPKLLTVSGRPASFTAGGEFPILVPQSLGTISIEYKKFGTRIDFVPRVMGNGKIHLEVRPYVSELDSANGVTLGTLTVPALRERSVDTAVEMKSGQTLAIAGLIQHRIETENKGVPFLADIPFIGGAFRRVEERINEVELLVIVTPELVGPMDAHEVPKYGPGELTTSPNDIDLYFRGYLEVPRCCQDGTCPSCQAKAASRGEKNASTGIRNFEVLQSSSDSTATPPTGGSGRDTTNRKQADIGMPISPQVNQEQATSPSGVRGNPYASSLSGNTDTAPQTTQPSPLSRDIPHKPTLQNPVNSTTDTDFKPGFIGPIGYDVLSN